MGAFGSLMRQRLIEQVDKLDKSRELEELEVEPVSAKINLFEEDSDEKQHFKHTINPTFCK